jgi:hypothetical protein
MQKLPFEQVKKLLKRDHGHEPEDDGFFSSGAATDQDVSASISSNDWKQEG